MFLPLKDDMPAPGIPWITGTLIAVNAAIFAAPSVAGFSAESLVQAYGLVPARLLDGDAGAWTTLATSLFLHGGLLHLGGNLLYLWIFGNNVESILGPMRFLLFYALTGLGGHALHVAIDPASTIPAIGASGAISGILGAYLLRYPGARIVCVVFLIVIVRVVRVPAAIVILLWLAVQLVGGVSELGSSRGGGVAWFEHLGGFATGLAFFPLLGGRRERRHGFR